MQLAVGDLLAPLSERDVRVDLVVANLPYLPSALIRSLPDEVAAWEPRLALDGGPDGMALLRRLVGGAAGVLGAGGSLLMEIGEEQAGPVASLMAAEGFGGIRSRRDLNGVERYIGGNGRLPARCPRETWMPRAGHRGGGPFAGGPVRRQERGSARPVRRALTSEPVGSKKSRRRRLATPAISRAWGRDTTGLRCHPGRVARVRAMSALRDVSTCARRARPARCSHGPVSRASRSPAAAPSACGPSTST